MKQLITACLLLFSTTLLFAQKENDAIQVIQGNVTTTAITFNVKNLQTCTASIQISYGSIDNIVNVQPLSIYSFQVPNHEQILKVRAKSFCSAHDKNWITIQVFKIDKPLPVKLISFSVSGNHISWKVTSETDFDSYLVEKSKDGINYSDAGRIKCTGATSYSFYDPFPLKVNYYRLKMIDRNGTFTYSSIIKSVIEKTEIASVLIFDLSGKQIASLLNNEYLEIKNKLNKPGVYLVKTFYIDNHSSTQKIMF